MLKKYEHEAHQFTQAIITIAASPKNLENLEHYLSIHFETWVKRYANTPETLVSEIIGFANMDID